MFELNPLRPTWLAYKRVKPDFIRVALTKSEMHAYYVALVSSYQLSLFGCRLVVR